MIEITTITCPKCGHQATERMPIEACQLFYVCEACGEKLQPKLGDCWVFCSYGYQCHVRQNRLRPTSAFNADMPYCGANVCF